jgi:hypothetical protein
MATELELCVETLLEGDEPQLLQALDLGLEEIDVRQVRIRAAAPEAGRLRHEREPERMVSLAACGGALLHEPLEHHRVDELGRCLEGVGAGSRDDAQRRRERPAQLRDVDLHELASRGRRLRSPERLDELVQRARASVCDQ